MSVSEILVILVVAVLVLGPDKLPDTIVQIAKILKALKRNIDDAKSSIEKEIRISELKNEAKKYQDEFSAANENIRKKLSFEEFDELKKKILNNKKVDLTFATAPDPYEKLKQEEQESKQTEAFSDEKQDQGSGTNEEKQNV